MYVLVWFNVSMFHVYFYVRYFKSISRDGRWKLAVATNALMNCIGKLLYDSLCLWRLSLSNKHEINCTFEEKGSSRKSLVANLKLSCKFFLDFIESKVNNFVKPG